MRFLDNNITYLYPELMQLGNDPEAPLCQLPKHMCLFASAREGLSYIAKTLETPTKRLLAPSYTCETVLLPFTMEGYTCAFYGMDKNLRINEEHFLGLLEHFRPDVIVVHPLYGMDLTQGEQAVLKKAKAQGCFIVEDLTQCIFSEKRYDFVDAYVGSLRKWLNIPDGGYYESKTLPPPENWQELPERTEFVKLQTANLYLRGLWEQNGDPNLRKIFGHINEIAVRENRNSWECYRISDFSRRLLTNMDVKANNQRRIANARYLYEKLKSSKNVEMVYSNVSDISTGPLWFPLYVKGDRDAFRKLKRFIKNGVYIAVLWPVETPAVVVDDTVRDIYDHIMALPCGQMYDECDMQHIVDVIEKD